MAYLRRIPRSPYWVAVFRMPDGHYANRSTKLEDRKAALKLADSWEDASRRRVTETQARQVVSDIHKQLTGEPLQTPTVTSYLQQWLTRKASETRPMTCAQYRCAVEEFESFLRHRAQGPLDHIEPNDVAKWRDQVAARTSARTANNKLK